MNISELLLNKADEHPHKLAATQHDIRLTFEQLAVFMLRAAGGFRAAGVKSEDTVAVVLVNPLEHWCATLALAHVGATMFSIPAGMAESQKNSLLHLTKCPYVLMESGSQWTFSGSVRLIY